MSEMFSQGEIDRIIEDSWHEWQEQEPCDDCISRQAVKELYYKDGYIDFHKICELPPVTPQYTEAEIQKMQELEQAEIQKAYELGKAEQQKMGRWITKDGKEQGYDIAGVKTWYVQIMCDKCGFIKTAIEGHTGQYNYCPNCGQPKMQEVEE